METVNQIETWFDLVLKHPDKHAADEIRKAKKERELEAEAAARAGRSIQAYRFNQKLLRANYSQKMDAADKIKKQFQDISFKDLGNMIIRELHDTCGMKGGKFTFHDKETKEKYLDIIRYFCDAPCEKMDNNRFMYIFGRFGNGKSVLVKTCYKILKYVGQDESNWRYFHIPSLVNQAQSQQNIKPFDILFNCTQNMILDEFGDDSEKTKIYGEDKIPMRSLLLDKYDKWISNNGRGQKIVITSNLFPERIDFYNKTMEANTILGFYDEKLLNKMKENYNLVRFPNVSYRDKNVKRF